MEAQAGKKLHLRIYIFILKFRERGENFSFQPHFKVPIAAFCLSLGPDASYVHD